MRLMNKLKPKHKQQPKKEPTEKTVVSPDTEMLVSRKDIAQLNHQLALVRKTAIIAARVMETMIKTHQCHGRPCEPCFESRVMASLVRQLLGETAVEVSVPKAEAIHA